MEDDTDEPRTNTEPQSEDGFSLLGNEIRVEIIRSLGDTVVREGHNHVRSFSELRSQTDTTLDPGQLNYHLQKLDGYFVKKTDNGYALRPEGMRLYFMLRAGFFDQREERESVDAGFDCYYCQAAVEGRFSGGRAKLECPDCEYRYLTVSVAPSIGAFEDETEAFEQFSKAVHHKVLGYARGICSACGNAVETDLVRPEEVLPVDDDRSKVYVHRWCNHCGAFFYLRVGEALLTDQDLLTFCYNHGVDVLSTPKWELEFTATDKHVTVLSTDPWEVALQVTYGGDTLELIVDEDVHVLERNRR